MEINYHHIVRDRKGQKIAEYISKKMHTVGEVISISYLETQGDYEILDVVPVRQVEELLTVTVIVKPVEPQKNEGIEEP